jgi:hypothetical protein
VAPEWAARGGEIVYISRENQMMATPFADGEAGKPQALFPLDKLLNRPVIFPSVNFYSTTRMRGGF